MDASSPRKKTPRKRPAQAKSGGRKRIAVDRWEFPKPIVAIFDEHRYATRLLHLLKAEAANLRAGKDADFESMEAIMRYFVEFPDRYHHPKEDLIFARMSGLGSEMRKTIARLERDHAKTGEQSADLYHRLQAQNRPTRGSRATALANKLDSYADALLAHMQLEEQSVFLPSRSALGDIDWQEINKAIPPVEDPLFGDRLAQDYVQLMERYLNEFTSVASSGSFSANAIHAPFVCLERLNYAAAKLRYQCRDMSKFSGEFAAERLHHLGEITAVRTPHDLLDWITEGADAHLQAWVHAAGSWRKTLRSITAKTRVDDPNAAFGPITLQTESELHAFREHPYQSAANPRLSWQAALTSLAFRLALKPMMRRMSHGDTSAIPSVERMPAPVTLEGTHREVVENRNFHAEWIKPDKQRATRRTLLHIPGGAFVFPASNGHRAMLGRLVRQTRANALLVHYRLLPEHPFPAGLEDAIAAYRFLLESGTAPEDITVSGDSAGGCLALALLLALREEGLPMPAACALISPLTDLSFSTAARITNQWRDPMTPRRMMKMAAYPLYVDASRVREPLVSPIFGNFEGLPPTFALVSSTETLLDDTLIVARKARAQGVDFEVEVWEGLPHAWPTFSFIPEGQQAITHVGEFFNRHLGKGSRRARASARR
ncbi:alpha/beta hydrolase fold domain-containing protein [Haliea sp. E17]|uniref:alpha/beta hydrolase fold domain-containing protein n=1 Tax=Haliea sp. E17 TaxID=3401576 RepID=UPI003AAE0B71